MVTKKEIIFELMDIALEESKSSLYQRFMCWFTQMDKVMELAKFSVEAYATTSKKDLVLELEEAKNGDYLWKNTIQIKKKQ